MLNMHPDFENIEGQLHYWPWSVEIPEESKDLSSHEVNFHYYGSPVITLARDAIILLPRRLESFRSLGPPYEDNYQTYETPHGVLSGRGTANKFKIITKKGNVLVSLNCIGACKRYVLLNPDSQEQSDHPLYLYVSRWSQIFDDLLEQSCKKKGSDNSGIEWAEVLNLFSMLKKEAKQPRMAVIVKIAEDMRKKVPLIILSMRKILLRERELIPIHRIQESDTSCIKWYVRQPGTTAAEKAGSRQCLLGVTRRPSFNTLENQVLHDFIGRCRIESSRYLKNDVGNRYSNLSERAVKVRGYKNLCSSYEKDPIFESIGFPPPGIKPNYVLQNDTRYKEIWYWYSRLLKHEQEEDSLWDWQGRTWADIMRLFVGAALELMSKGPSSLLNNKNAVLVKPLVEAPFYITVEQDRGGRITPGSLPGPFLVRLSADGKGENKSILEIVHPDVAYLHPIIKHFGRLGGQLYLVIHPLASEKKKKKVIVLWSINGAGVESNMPYSDMASSAAKAITYHTMILSRRRAEFPNLAGAVIVSTLKTQTNLFYLSDNSKIPVLEVSADPAQWLMAVENLCVFLKKVFS